MQSGTPKGLSNNQDFQWHSRHAIGPASMGAARTLASKQAPPEAHLGARQLPCSHRGMCTKPRQACGLRGCCGAAAARACAPPVDGGKRRAYARAHVHVPALNLEDFFIDHPVLASKSRVGGQDPPGLASNPSLLPHPHPPHPPGHGHPVLLVQDLAPQQGQGAQAHWP